MINKGNLREHERAERGRSPGRQGAGGAHFQKPFEIVKRDRPNGTSGVKKAVREKRGRQDDS